MQISCLGNFEPVGNIRTYLYVHVLSRLCVGGFYVQYIAIKYKEFKKKRISSRNQKDVGMVGCS